MRLILLALLTALLSACGAAKVAGGMFTGEQGLGTPQPFLRDNRNEALLRSPFLRGALVIPPIEGLAPEDAQTLRIAMAESLRRSDVAALLDEPGSGGVAATLSARTDGEDVHFELRDPSGELIGDFDARGVLGRPGLDYRSFGEAAGREAARLITDIQGGPAPERAKIAVAVVSMSGAPADGDDALPRALRAILAQGGPVIGYEVLSATADIPDDAFRIEGEAGLAPLDDGRIRVRLSWRLLSPEGEVLGAVTQANPVPADAFDEGWGPAAFDVALGAAEGLGALLDRARSAMETPPDAAYDPPPGGASPE